MNEPNYTKERYTWYKQHRICIQCGANEAAKKHTRCLECMSKNIEKSIKYQAKNATKKRERMRKKGALPWILRGNGLYCFHCCKPVCKGEKLCRECYEKMCENLRVASEKERTSPDNWRNKKFDFRKRIKEE